LRPRPRSRCWPPVPSYPQLRPMLSEHAHCTEGNMDEKEKEKKRKERESGTACSANSHRNQRMPKPSATGWWEGRRHDPLHSNTAQLRNTCVHHLVVERETTRFAAHNPNEIGAPPTAPVVHSCRAGYDWHDCVAAEPLELALRATAAQEGAHEHCLLCALGHPHWLQPAL